MPPEHFGRLFVLKKGEIAGGDGACRGGESCEKQSCKKQNKPIFGFTFVLDVWNRLRKGSSRPVNR